MEHTRRIHPIPPTPALVLVLDQLGFDMAADVEAIFLNGDSRRAAVTRFLALTYDTQDGLALTPVQEVAARNPAPDTRREACQVIIDHAASLRAGLEAELRDLHTHQRLAQAGLGSVVAPPLDVFLVADLTDPSSSGAALPLAYLVQDLVTRQAEGKGHLLLSTASFEPADGDGLPDALAYCALQELDTLLDPGTAAKRHLAKALGLEADAFLSLPVYLFDHHKEGTRAVKDRAELRVILGNFLLALLSGGLAQRLAGRLPQPEVLERRAFYSSGTATALVFEPKPLIEACAGRLGGEYLLAEMGPEATADPRAAAEWATRREDRMGSPRLWMERLCNNTPCEPQSDNEGLRLGLHFHGFRFDTVPKEDWADKIASYSVLFGQTKLPRYTQVIEENAKSLAEEVAADLEAALDGLPQSPQLYPGGLRTARLALQKLDERLEDRAEELSSGARAIPLHQEATLEELNTAAWNFPDLPAFIARPVILCTIEVYSLLALARGLRQHLAGHSWPLWLAALGIGGITAGACALWLWRKDHRLVTLRERCIRYCEMRYAALLEGKAREHLIALCGRLRGRVASAIEDLSQLEQDLTEARERLEAIWEAYASAESPSEGTGSGSHGIAVGSHFRPSASDDAVAGWVYSRWRQPPEQMRQPLLEEQDLLDGWRLVTAETLVQRLLAYGRKAFGPVWELSLGDILRRRPKSEADMLWGYMARETIPLLRPQFDRLGGGGHVQTVRHLLVADGEFPGLSAAIQHTLSDWEIDPTGDPYIAICCRGKQLIPLAALQDLGHRGQRAYLALEPGAQGGILLFDEWMELGRSLVTAHS